MFELPILAAKLSDCPESWIKNIELVNLWAKEMKYNTHGVNYFKMPDGEMVCSLPEGKRIRIPTPDALGNVVLGGQEVDYQTALDRAYNKLASDFESARKLWDLDLVKKWGKAPATEKQLTLINRMYRDFDTTGLTKMQAGQILNRKFGGRK